MLNIAESVPPPEPVPSNSGNSVIIQYNISTRHWPSSIKFLEFHAIPELEAIPEIPESDGIPGIPSNSVSTQFRNYLSPSPSRIVLWSKISLWDKWVIPVRDSGNRVDRELHGISKNS
jgi:hypothetical protein